MEQSQPKKPDVVFKFSYAVAEEQERDLDLRLQAIDARIDRFTRKTIIRDTPVLAMILSMTHDKEELALLGDSLVRVSELINEYDDLRTQKAIVSLAKDHPERLRLMFGDFSDEMDTFLEDLRND